MIHSSQSRCNHTNRASYLSSFSHQSISHQSALVSQFHHQSDNIIYLVWFFLLLLSSQLLFRLFKQIRLGNNFLPGPSRLPILGNLLQLGNKPHKALAEIAKIHGPLVSLQLGWRTTIVISSPSVAQEMFQKNDAVFAGRNVGHSQMAVGHNLASVVFLSSGPRWRYLRRICTSHIFAPSRIDATQEFCKEKIKVLLTYVRNCCETKIAVGIGQSMFTTSLNILSNIIFSFDFASLTSSDSKGYEMREIVSDLLKVGSQANISDFFPVFKSFDPQGIYRQTKVLVEKMIKMFEDIIEQRMKRGHGEENDVLDILLKINQEGIQKDTNESIDIPHLLLDLFVAGTDTTSSTIEWAMTELLGNPEKMKKLKTKLDEVIDDPNNPIKEKDIPQLPYLNAVIKETFRLHPPAPFLIPRNVTEDVKLYGFMIPKDAQVLVNVWAIGRDDSVWKDAESFVPERFLGSTVDIKGRHYDLFPFGSRRRLYVEMSLALTILPLALGSLIHAFDWRIIEGAHIDMDDKFGITLQKAQPLYVIPSCV